MGQKIIRFSSITSALLAAICGCCSSGDGLFVNRIAPDQESLGPTQFAVVSVARLDDVEIDLQPKFEITPASALSEVAPDTLSVADARFRGFQASLALGLPTSTSKQDVVTTSTDPAKPPTVTSTDTQSSGPGTAPTVSQPAVDSKSSGGTSTAFATGSAQIEPTLKYNLATSLYQYVNLTNRYIKDRVNPNGYQAFVVRMQVGLMPERRGMPYDTYVDVAFFPAVRQQVQDKSAQFLPIKQADDALDKAVIVVPLLSADTLEGVLQARTNEELRQLAFGIAATIQNVGVGVNAASVARDLQAVLGRDYNSVASVGMRNDSLVRIRLGALQQATTQYGMVPRQQTISVIILVRQDALPTTDPAKTLTAMALTRHINAIDGSIPPFRSALDRSAGLHEIASRYQILSNLSDAQLEELSSVAAGNDIGAFQSQLRAFGAIPAGEQLNLNTYGALWIELANYKPASRPIVATFELPPPSDKARPPELPPESTLVLTDDGSTSKGRLFNGKRLARSVLVATLKPLPIPGGQSLPPSPAKEIGGIATVQSDGATIELSFDSVSRTFGPNTVMSLELNGTTGTGTPIETGPRKYSVLNNLPLRSTPAQLIRRSDRVEISDGKVILPFKAQRATDGRSYYLLLDAPAKIVGFKAADRPIYKDGERWKIDADGDFDLIIEGVAQERITAPAAASDSTGASGSSPPLPVLGTTANAMNTSENLSNATPSPSATTVPATPSTQPNPNTPQPTGGTAAKDVRYTIQDSDGREVSSGEFKLR